MIDMDSLGRIRSIADYQFGQGVGRTLFPEGVHVSYASRTGRIRHVHYRGRLIATLRPTDGLFSLTVEGGSRFMLTKPYRSWVEVQDDIADFIAMGRTVFAKHIVNCDVKIRPREEVVVIDSHRKVLAVGRAVLTGEEMLVFQRGVAVRIRRGVAEGLRVNVKKEKQESQ